MFTKALWFLRVMVDQPDCINGDRTPRSKRVVGDWMEIVLSAWA